MSVLVDDVKKIAYLARVEIKNKEVTMHANDLSEMLDLMVQMNDLNTDLVQPMSHPLESSQRLRIDTVTEVDQRDKFQSLAPQVRAGLYLVPKVID